MRKRFDELTIADDFERRPKRTMSKHKRTYKDSVFVDLFSEDERAKDNFLSLYNALHGTHLDSSTQLKPLKLEQAMYTKLSNDVSCLIDNKIIVLAEHQSTINENMPLRCLQYVARLYEQIQESKAKYYRTLQKIPAPEFYVFYNGMENYPAHKTLKLSDAYMVKPERAPLELTVQVLNINTDKASMGIERPCPIPNTSFDRLTSVKTSTTDGFHCHPWQIVPNCLNVQTKAAFSQCGKKREGFREREETLL